MKRIFILVVSCIFIVSCNSPKNEKVIYEPKVISDGINSELPYLSVDVSQLKSTNEENDLINSCILFSAYKRLSKYTEYVDEKIVLNISDGSEINVSPLLFELAKKMAVDWPNEEIKKIKNRKNDGVEIKVSVGNTDNFDNSVVKPDHFKMVYEKYINQKKSNK